jgi:hypothetical protein
MSASLHPRNRAFTQASIAKRKKKMKGKGKDCRFNIGKYLSPSLAVNDSSIAGEKGKRKFLHRKY